MEKYSAAYAYTNYNFVIQNLNGSQDKRNEYYSLICVLKNIIQRGCPTYMSKYLEGMIGKIDLDEKRKFGLIDKDIPRWINTIKGDNENNNYPANVFLEEIIPRYFTEYEFIQKLIIPEVYISDIVGKEDKQFINQKVDFYLHQCRLVIEIDGFHHNEKIQSIIDKERDEYLYKQGIQTVRIKTNEMKEKNKIFRNKINLIRSILHSCNNQLNLYKNYRNIEEYDKDEIKHLRANAVVRMQLTVLSLLEKGILKLDDDIWQINILERDIYDFTEIAIEDLFIWFENLCVLNKVCFRRPKLNILETRDSNIFIYKREYINIDFSLNKRWTDENKLNKNIIYVRTDYYDKKRYFKVSTTDSICYKINKEDDKCIKSLEFLLKNIFRHDNFRDGQLSIIINSLQGEDTIGILPTGTGKSVCYQLTALLQPCISFVVCPIKSLIYDQKLNLNNRYIDNVEYITGDVKGEEKENINNSFINGKYQILIISPERFQIKIFRNSLQKINENSSVALAVIDEVHCLSEWGHDFRTSYLNLVKTIRNFTPSARLLGLTATASNFVLQDLKKEFEIDSYNVKTLTSFTREELKFKVIKCNKENRGGKEDILFKMIKDLNQSNNIFELNDKETKSGIIFTPHVNGEKGCYSISNKINSKFKTNSEYYSGKIPQHNNVEIMNSKEFNIYKERVQKEFKNNKIPLLVSTKAFGMGVDKPNIRYTIHYGMPASLESLYQEAGRAGRDKKDADCYILYECENISKDILNKFFSLDTPIEELKKIQENINRKNQKDILGNFFLWLLNNKGVEYEFNVTKSLYDKYAKSSSTQKVQCRELGYSLMDIQKAIYRLSVIGIVEDWIIEVWDDRKGILEVTFNEFNIENINNSMEEYIYKYNKEFSLKKLKESNIGEENKKTYFEMIQVLNDDNMNEVEKVIKALLIWIYDNIVYKRRQSIKTISDLCNKFEDGELFKKEIENHFKFDDDTYMLDDIAENPTQYEKWFEVLRDESGNYNKNKAENVKGRLARFLESYRFSTGLNFISGFIRLMTDEYNDLDGKQRLESAFNQIETYEEYIIDNIIESSLEFGKQLDNKNRLYLSELLCNYCNNKLKIHEELEDDYSLTLILKETNDKLKGISRRIKCQMQGI